MQLFGKSFFRFSVVIQNKALELSFFLSLPAAVALFVASEPIISSLFGYGSFSEIGVKNSATALFYFAFGLPAFDHICLSWYIHNNNYILIEKNLF